MKGTTFALACLVQAVVTVSAHGAVRSITGINGVVSGGFGLQQNIDVTGDVPKGVSVKGSPCGQLVSGPIDVQTELTKALAATGGKAPTFGPTGKVTITFHQVNEDGAGPAFVGIDSTGTGASFKPITILTQVPGTNGFGGTDKTDFPLVVQIPEGQSCTGGPDKNLCLLQVKTSRFFGGCAIIAVDSDSDAGKASATTAATATTTAAVATETGKEGTATAGESAGQTTEGGKSGESTTTSQQTTTAGQTTTTSAGETSEAQTTTGTTTGGEKSGEQATASARVFRHKHKRPHRHHRHHHHKQHRPTKSGSGTEQVATKASNGQTGPSMRLRRSLNSGLLL